MSTSELPEMWKSAIITPVFKKGSASDPSTHRPISLTCVATKIMEAVIKNDILAHLLTQKLITRQQHGFLARRSTCTQLLECRLVMTGRFVLAEENALMLFTLILPRHSIPWLKINSFKN
jgi:hypothetical protein